ncbi:MAG: hypothetical protein RIR70_1397 [Pseudomonadota bacterium]
MYSIKLVFHPSTQAANPQNLDPKISFKIKYRRAEDPSPDNPLRGLFDYTQWGKILAAKIPGLRAVTDTLSIERDSLDHALLGELGKQQIREGKYKLYQKLANSATPLDHDWLRVAGEADAVQINHGHFAEYQKHSETGRSCEKLGWVIKLALGDADREKMTSVLNNKAFQDAVNEEIRRGLGEGRALELVNDAIKAKVTVILEEAGIAGCKAQFKLKRGELIPGARVVVGETTTLGNVSPDTPEPAMPPAGQLSRERKYCDFALPDSKANQ